MTAAEKLNLISVQGLGQKVFEGTDALVPLAEIDTELPLAEVYEAVAFTPEPDEDDT